MKGLPPPPVAEKPVPPPAPPAPPPAPDRVAVAPVPSDAGTPAPRPPEKGPEPGTEFDPAISTPSFTFRTMDHLPADVYLNGYLNSSTVCLWSATLNTDYDPKIPVTAWPPAGAKMCGKASRPRQGPFSSTDIELWIEGGHYEHELFAPVRARYPHLVDGEQILYVKARWGVAERMGAVRLRIVGKDGAHYRWVDFTADLSQEDEVSARFRNSLWFLADRPGGNR